MDHQQKAELATDLLKAAPVVTVGGAVQFWGISLPDWAAILAIIYTGGLLIQMGHRFWLWACTAWKRRGKRKP